MVKAGYILTEIGEIPEDWTISSVGEEFNVELGKMLDAEKNRGEPKPFLGNRSVQWGRIDISDLGEIKLTSADKQRYRLRDGDLLVCEGGDVGRAAIWRQEISECYYQKALHRLRAKRGFAPLLMLNILHAYSTSGFLLNYATQTSIAHLSKDQFVTIPIPVPSGEKEQQAIVDALSDADALIESLEQFLIKKRQIKQGAMQELLTCKRRLPKFCEPWETKRLGDISEIVMGQSPSSLNYNSKGHGLPLIQGNADINNRKTIIRNFTTQVTKRGRPGDILISVRAPVGEVSRATFDICLGRGVCAVRFPNNFLYHFLIFLEPSWAKHSKGSTFDSVNSADLKAIEVYLPTDSTEQIAIADLLTGMDMELDTLDIQLAKVRAIKQGMMQVLLTGRIRLI